MALDEMVSWDIWFKEFMTVRDSRECHLKKLEDAIVDQTALEGRWPLIASSAKLLALWQD